MQFSIWRALDCPCYLHEDQEGLPEAVKKLERTCRWEVSIYNKDGLLITSAADDGGHEEREPKDNVLLKYDETYKVVLKQTCDVLYTICGSDCGGLHTSSCLEYEKSLMLGSTTEYIGKWELKEISDEWHAIFYYTTEDGSLKHLSNILRPLQKK